MLSYYAECRGVLIQVNSFNSNGIDKLLKPLDAPKLRARLYHWGHDIQHNDTSKMPISTMTLSIMTLSIMTLSTMTLSIMTLSIMTLSIIPLSVKAFSIMTLSIMTPSMKG